MGPFCIECKKFVNSRQEALLCDGCNKWQHRICNSGVPRDTYRNAVKSGEDIPWQCKPCATAHVSGPNFESTRNEDSSASLGTVTEVTMFSHPPSSILFELPTASIIWDQYASKDKSAEQLLRACSKLYGPVRSS